MLKLNGQPTPITQNQTLHALLTESGFNPAQVVAELNGKIIDRQHYGTITLNDGDVLEVVTFVGGG